MKKILIIGNPKQLGYKLLGNLQRDYLLQVAHDSKTVLPLIANNMFDLALVDQCQIKHIVNVAAALNDKNIPFIFIYQNKPVAGHGEVGFLQKPLDDDNAELNIISAIKLGELLRKKQRDQVVNVAVGIIMHKTNSTRAFAYRLLRDKSRSNNIKIAETAASIVNHVDELNKILA